VIACQGGGSHAAYAAGALKRWLPLIERSQGREAIALRGLSGTSGGALCALLAWYGLLQGGAAAACTRLDAFWQSNCAQSPGEQLWNGATIAAIEALPFEISFSPATWPLREGLTALTSTWPATADALGPFNPWGRGDFFQLDSLIGRQVDFQLVEALGALLGIANDIRRWRQADVQCRLNPPLDSVNNEELKQRLALSIRANAEQQPRAIRERMGTGFGDTSVLRHAMADWPESVQGDMAPFDALEAAVKKVRDRIPHLLIGAVDVGSGEFVAFSSENAPADRGISLAAVLASAALPWVSEAVAVPYVAPNGDGGKPPHRFWDGLFSQNPPIKNFLAGKQRDRIPNEIWVLQINPRDYDIENLGHGVADRRNELAGNLSLQQEIEFIEAVNKRVTRRGGADHKRVQVHRVILERAAVQASAPVTLDALSKFDRSAVLKDALMAHGEQQGQRFLRMRSAAELACDRLDGSPAEQVSAEPKEAASTLAVLRTIKAAPGEPSLRLHIDETILPSSGIGELATIRATVRWHTRGVLKDGGAGVQIEGESDIDVVDHSETITVSQVRITEVTVEDKRETAVLEAARKVNVPQAGLEGQPPRPKA
jgi:predicted acylesterase/phospholipase RssA